MRMRSLMRLAMTAALASLVVPAHGNAQQDAPEVFGTFDGDEMYTVLPRGAIPAISEPTFVTGEAAQAQMHAEEHVIGVVVDGEARAYSTWQLDSHEIVNDRIQGTAIAVTW